MFLRVKRHIVQNQLQSIVAELVREQWAAGLGTVGSGLIGYLVPNKQTQETKGPLPRMVRRRLASPGLPCYIRLTGCSSTQECVVCGSLRIVCHEWVGGLWRALSS